MGTFQEHFGTNSGPFWDNFVTIMGAFFGYVNIFLYQIFIVFTKYFLHYLRNVFFVVPSFPFVWRGITGENLVSLQHRLLFWDNFLVSCP